MHAFLLAWSRPAATRTAEVILRALLANMTCLNELTATNLCIREGRYERLVFPDWRDSIHAVFKDLVYWKSSR